MPSQARCPKRALSIKMLKNLARRNSTVAGNKELFSKLKNVLNGFDAPIRYAVVNHFIIINRLTVLVRIAKKATKTNKKR
jgi:hypothetical protein